MILLSVISASFFIASLMETSWLPLYGRNYRSVILSIEIG